MIIGASLYNILLIDDGLVILYLVLKFLIKTVNDWSINGISFGFIDNSMTELYNTQHSR